MKGTIHLTIMSPHSVVWEGAVRSLSSENSEGPFDILPEHARFISLIHAHPVQVELLDGTEKEFRFESAVLAFENDEAKIYMQERELPS